MKLWTIDQESGNADFALKDMEKQVSKNENSLDNYPSRPVKDALRDYMQKFRSLEWIPGGLQNETWNADNYARLYRENGWPSNFDREAFLTASANWEDEDEARRRPKSRLRK